MTSDELQRGLPPAGDRLMTTLFVAALLHAIVILGVTFSAPQGGDDDGATHGLEVVLVDDQAPAVANPDAAYLAQRSQHGSGNTLDAGRTLIPRSAPLAALQPGSSRNNGSGDAQDAGSSSGEAERLATTARSPRRAAHSKTGRIRFSDRSG